MKYYDYRLDQLANPKNASYGITKAESLIEAIQEICTGDAFIDTSKGFTLKIEPVTKTEATKRIAERKRARKEEVQKAYNAYIADCKKTGRKP